MMEFPGDELGGQYERYTDDVHVEDNDGEIHMCGTDDNKTRINSHLTGTENL